MHVRHPIGPAPRFHGLTREAHAEQLVGALASGHAVRGATPLGGPVGALMPDALREALVAGPEAANALLLARPSRLPTSTIDWGSGGSHVGVPSARGVEGYFRSIFEHIEAQHPTIRVGPEDLFHGHTFATGPGELGILFHAREYPYDLTGHQSGFNSNDRGYADRNLLYLSSTDQVYVLDARRGAPHRALLQDLGIPDLEEQALAIDEGLFYSAFARLPDVNLLPERLAGGGPDRMFFKGYEAPDPSALVGVGDGYDRKEAAKKIAEALGHKNRPCGLELRKDPPPPPSGGTGASGPSWLSIRLVE